MTLPRNTIRLGRVSTDGSSTGSTSYPTTWANPPSAKPGKPSRGRAVHDLTPIVASTGSPSRNNQKLVLAAVAVALVLFVVTRLCQRSKGDPEATAVLPRVKR